MSCLNFVALFLACVTLVASAPTAHVVVVIGQSNSVGVNSGGFTPEDVTYPNLLQTSCCVNGGTDNNQCQLVQGKDPLHHQCDTGYLNSQNVGFGMNFARSLRAEIPEDDVIVLVPAGIGGTGFVDGVWTAYTGNGFQQALLRIKATFQLLAQQYPQHSAVLEGFIWHQGEADAATPTETFLTRDLMPMIRAWRDTNLIPQTNANVPFVVGNLVPAWVADKPNMMTALQILDQYMPYTASTPSQGLLGAPNDNVHFTAPSQRIFGKRYYAAWKLAKANAPDTSA